LTVLVTDTLETAKFYRELGFAITGEAKEKVSAALGEFQLDFYDEKTVQIKNEAGTKPKGLGIYININVESVDAYYQSLLDKGLKPSSSPRDWSWGNREFVIRDPDEYKLVFYEKLKK
jgi:uncharacterized glyoxalase superfamily protein PhnB